MAFRVNITPQAYADLDDISNYILARSSFEMAERWFNGIFDDVRSLHEMPFRCPVVPETGALDEEVRVLLHGRKNRTYKVYFSVRGDIVHVFHIRHWARKPIAEDELQELMDDLDLQ